LAQITRVADVLDAAPLDPTRRPLTDRVAAEQQRDHHRRIMRRPPVAVRAIGAVEPGQIELSDRVDDEPRQVILRQPLPQARRQQQRLVAVTREEVLRHAVIVNAAPDGNDDSTRPTTRASRRPPR
jgi:hypothetical protein